MVEVYGNRLRLSRVYLSSSECGSLSKFITGPATVFISRTNRARTYLYSISQGYPVSLEYALRATMVVAIITLITELLLEKMICKNKLVRTITIN